MEDRICYLEFGGRVFPYREILFEGCWNIIATTELSQNLLQDGGGDWVSEEARVLDEKILFFLEPDKIFLPAIEIHKILQINIH